MLEQTLDIAGKDGAMETFICRPERGAHPAVFLLMDAPGIREELRDMARRSPASVTVYCCPTFIIAPGATPSMDRRCWCMAVPSISACAPSGPR